MFSWLNWLQKKFVMVPQTNKNMLFIHILIRIQFKDAGVYQFTKYREISSNLQDIFQPLCVKIGHWYQSTNQLMDLFLMFKRLSYL